jgi:hypothetical protein
MIQFPNNYNPEQHIYYFLHDISDFRKHIDKYENLINEEFEKYNEYLYNDKKFFEYYQRFGTEYNLSNLLSEEFPNLHKRSALISILSLFEHKMNILCELYRNILKLTVSFRDMREGGIDQSRMYLEKIVGLDISNIHWWDDIKNFQKIRNKIVHQDSEIYNEDLEIISFIKKSEGIELYELSNYKEIRIKKPFLVYCLDTIEKFINELLEKIKSLNAND